MYAVGGIAPEIDLRINNADIGTLSAALLTRLFYVQVGDEVYEPPVPDSNHVFQTLREFKSQLCCFQATPVSLDVVVEMYKGRKRTIYENALSSLEERPVCRADSISLAFVKCEKTNPSKAPRCIQPRDPRYNLELGAYIKTLEKRIYRRIAKIFGDGPTVIKGYNVQEIANIMTGKWNSFIDPAALDLDARRFDAHVSEPVLRWEHSCYLKIYRNCPKLRKLLLWQIYNKGKGYCKDGKLTFSILGRRFSGDMNTALGNCIIMCALIYAYSRYVGVDIKLMNNGDDCVVFMERRDVNKFLSHLTPWFSQMGFNMDCAEPCYELAAIEFCQMHCIRTVNGPVMVRNMPTSLSKDALSIVPLRDEITMRKWLASVGDCGIALTRGVPIAHSFYSAYCRNGIGGSKISQSLQFNTGIHHLMHNLSLDNDEITDEARLDVYTAWGILPDDQIVIEDLYSTLTIDYGDFVYDDHSAYPHFEWA